MNELEMRIRLQQLVQNFAEQNLQQVPAYMLEDAFAHTMVFLKERAFQEYMIYSAQQQEKAENESKEETPKEQE